MQRNKCTGTIKAMISKKIVPILFTVLLIILYIPGVFWGLPSEIVSEKDSQIPFGPLAFVADYSNPSLANQYPDVHYILLVVIYAGVFLFHKIIGNLHTISSTWPYGFQNPAAAFSMLILVSRLVSVSMGIAIILCMKKFLAKNISKTGLYFSLTLLAVSGVFTYYSRTTTLDIPFLFWWVLSLVFLWNYIFTERKEGKYLVVSAIFSALSLGTKDQAAGLIFGSVLVLLFIGAQEQNRNQLKVRVKQTGLFVVIVLFTYLFVAVLPQPFRWIFTQKVGHDVM